MYGKTTAAPLSGAQAQKTSCSLTNDHRHDSWTRTTKRETQTWKLHGPSWIPQEHSTPIQWRASREKWAHHGKSCPKIKAAPHFPWQLPSASEQEMVIGTKRHERWASPTPRLRRGRKLNEWNLNAPMRLTARLQTRQRIANMRFKVEVICHRSNLEDTQSRILSQGECSHLGLKSYPLAWLAGSLTTGKPPMRGCFIF